MYDDSFWPDGGRQRSENTYDTAQICLNGDIANKSYNKYPQFNKAFCPICGEKTITECTNCNKPIRGAYSNSLGGRYNKPAYCINCGEPYPWTQRTQDAAYELIEFSNLNQNEKDDFKNSITDLMVQSPKTNVAQVKFIAYATKTGIEIAKALKGVLVDVVSETVKKAIWKE